MATAVLERALPWKIQPAAISWAPTLDLVVFAPVTGDHVTLYRLSGQKVWSSNNRKRARAVYSTWKNDGKCFAVIYDDQSYQIFSTSTGKIVHTSEPRKASHVTWLKGDQLQDQSVDTKNIMDIDVLRSLPRLLPLPSGHQLFTKGPTGDPANIPIELFAEGTCNAEFHLDIYGFFPIGGPPAQSSDVEARIISINASKDLSRYFTLVKGKSGDLEVICYGTRLIQKLGPLHLPEVSLVPAMIHGACDYVKDGLNTLMKEIKSLQEISTKLFSSVASMDLLLNDLFCALISGVVGPELSSWMEEVNESGFKKYSSTAYESYDNSRKILFENIIPGCERAIVLSSRLRGLARWKERGSVMGLNPEGLTSIIEKLSQVTKESHQFLWLMTTELELFKSFISWLEHLFNVYLERNMQKTGIEHITKSEVKTVDVSKFMTSYLNTPSVSANMVNDTMAAMWQVEPALRQTFEEIKAALRKEIFSEPAVPLSAVCYSSQMRLVNSVLYIYCQQAEKTSELLLFKLDSKNKRQVSNLKLRLPFEYTQVDFLDDNELLFLQSDRMIRINYKQFDFDQGELTLDESECEEIDLNGFQAVHFALGSNQEQAMICLLRADLQHFKFIETSIKA